jgi:hypothetical protein
LRKIQTHFWLNESLTTKSGKRLSLFLQI